VRVADEDIRDRWWTAPARADPRQLAGIWLINHLCDLVQIRSTTSGTVLRLRGPARPADAGTSGPVLRLAGGGDLGQHNGLPRSMALASKANVRSA
jgi:hypothetical protein